MSEEKESVMDEILEDDDIDIDDVDSEETDESGEEEKASEKEAKPEESIESLSKRVEALAKEKDGMYKEMLSERKTRQELKGRLDAITELMAQAQANREKAVNAGAEAAVEGSVKTSQGIPVSFDENGNPFVNPKDIPKGTDSAEMAALKKELAALKNQQFYQQAVDKNQQILAGVLGKDERFPLAYAQVQQAYRYLDAATDHIIKSNGLDVDGVNLDDMLGMLEEEYGDEFDDKFPGLRMDLVVEACTSGANGLLRPYKVQKALSVAANHLAGTTKGKQQLKNLQVLTGKPGNLSGMRNQKGTVGRTLGDIANMSVSDFERMSDADFDKLQRAIMRMSG